MKHKIIALSIAAIAACQVEDPQPSINSTGGVMFQQLTDGSGNLKSWSVMSATLTSNSTALDVTNLANVKDDELVFSAAKPGSRFKVDLSWKVRNEIKFSATKVEEVLLDYYLSAIKSQISIAEDGSISTSDANLKLESISENEVRLRYLKGNVELELILAPSVLSQSQIPASLQFEKISELTGTGLEQAAGFTGSMASNSLYIAYKDLDVRAERVMKYDIAGNSYTYRDFDHTDFVTKEIHIINDKLKVIGGQFVNSYSLDLESDPISVPHSLVLTRFGSTVVDDNIYLFGGDLDIENSASTNANHIYKHDQNTGQLKEVGQLPESRYWSHGEIVDGKLYVFGGRQSFIADAPEDDIFIWDLESNQTQNLKLPKAMHRTFAARSGHLIYIAGQIVHPDETLETTMYETVFGVFDTHEDTFKVLPTPLATVAHETVYGFTIVGDNLYILYGSNTDYTFAIYKAPLQIL